MKLDICIEMYETNFAQFNSIQIEQQRFLSRSTERTQCCLIKFEQSIFLSIVEELNSNSPMA